MKSSGPCYTGLEKTSVFFRCDAGLNYGFGHLMRCVSLAQAFHRSGIMTTTFLVRNLSNSAPYDKLLMRNGLDCVFLPRESKGLKFAFERYAHPGNFNIMVFDNYDVTTEQMISHQKRFGNLVAIDDLADRKICADFIINQNLNADGLNYKTVCEAKSLLGPSYTLLRNDILNMRKNEMEKKNNHDHLHIFMSFGGGNVLDRIKGLLTMFQALDRILESKICIDFAISNDMEQAEEIKQRLSGLMKIDIRLIRGEYNLAPIMKRSDFAVTAAGTSVFEMAFLGIPQIAIIIDRNQEITGRNINEKGFGVCLGDIESLSEEKFLEVFFKFLRNKTLREKMSLSGQSCIDGKGADRVVSEIIHYYKLDIQTA